MKKINCLRCDVPMVYRSTENIQLGKTGFLLGDLPNLFAGAIKADIYICPQCNKIEMFNYVEVVDDSPQPPKITCPGCGHRYDPDMRSCPKCGL